VDTSAAVLGFAQRFDATNQVDDLDGAAGVAPRDVESANAGGEIRSWSGPARDLPTVLVDAVRALPVPLGQGAWPPSNLIRSADVQQKAVRDEELLWPAGDHEPSQVGGRDAHGLEPSSLDRDVTLRHKSKLS
jgi:hypothetical protein